MAYPVGDPEWADDTNIATGTEAGTPTKVDPGTGYLSQGFVPGATFIGPYANFVIHRLTQWVLLYLKDLHNQAEFLNKSYTWIAAHVFNGSTITGTSSIDMAASIEGNRFLIDHATNTYDYKVARAETKFVSLAGGSVPNSGSDTWKLDLSSGKLVSSASGTRVFPVLLPPGAVITGVAVGAEAPTGAVSMSFDRHVPDLAGAVVVTSGIVADTTGGTAWESLGGATSITVDAGSYYYVVVNGDQASQLVTFISVAFNNPGPR